MVIGTGTDIIEISRIKKISENTKFLTKMFTVNELKYLRAKGPESTAGYFCAKEAVSKALGTGFAGFKFNDLEIVKIDGAPFVKLHGNALKIAQEKGIEQINVSISHSKDYATAVAVAEGSRKINNTFVISDDKVEISTQKAYPLSIYKKRNADTHKGNYGKVYIIGGSYNMSGAVILASKAALRTGSGLVTSVIPKTILDRVGSGIVEATYMPCEDSEGSLVLSEESMDKILDKSDAIAIGPGIGMTKSVKNCLSYLLLNGKKPLVIDADAITMLTDIKNKLKNTECKVVLTPHLGEMSKLVDKEIEYIKSNKVETAKNFAKEYKCIVLLKGSETIVTDGNKVYCNTTGNPGMASGGSGDVLTGIIVSLIGQGYDVFDAAALGAHLHGLAGDMAYNRYGYGLIASDIIDFIGNYLKG